MSKQCVVLWHELLAWDECCAVVDEDAAKLVAVAGCVLLRSACLRFTAFMFWQLVLCEGVFPAGRGGGKARVALACEGVAALQDDSRRFEVLRRRVLSLRLS